MRARHAAALVELTALREAQLAGPDEIASLDRLELDHDNVRAALRWSSRPRRRDLGVAAGDSAMWRFWERRGYHQEARDWLEQALAASGDGAPLEARGNALNALAMMHWSTADAEPPNLSPSRRSLRAERQVTCAAWPGHWSISASLPTTRPTPSTPLRRSKRVSRWRASRPTCPC